MPDSSRIVAEDPRPLHLQMLAQARHDLKLSWWSIPLVPLLLTSISYFSYRTHPGFDEIFGQFVYNATASVCVGGAAVMSHSILRPLHDRHFPERDAHGVAFQLAFLMFAVLLGVEVFILLSSALDLGPAQARARSTLYAFGVMCVLALTLIFASTAAYRRKIAKEERRAQSAELAAVQANLSALQSRTNPHFLFNALNTIAGLIEEDSQSAVGAVEKLASLLRYTLRASESPSIEVEREIEAVRDYLTLQELRFGNRLRHRIDIEPGLGRRRILPLMIQPLVENAVLHGVESHPSGAEVRIRIAQTNDSLHIQVLDTGKGPAKTTGANFSHRNLSERLHLNYGSAATFEISRPQSGGYCVDIRLPLEDSSGPPRLRSATI